MDDDYFTQEYGYFLEIATPQFLSTRMKKLKSDYLEPGYSYIIVSKLTKEIIHDAIQAYIDTEEDAYWLKLYHVSGTLNIEDLNSILSEKKQKNIELDAEIDTQIAAKTDEETDK